MSKRSASRCPSASTSRPILIIGVTTSDRANEVAYFDRTWAASVPARAVADTVWYTDSWRTPMPRCAHILPKATDVLTRRVQILDDVYARYRHHLWYVVVEDDVYVYPTRLAEEHLDVPGLVTTSADSINVVLPDTVADAVGKAASTKLSLRRLQELHKLNATASLLVGHVHFAPRGFGQFLNGGSGAIYTRPALSALVEAGRPRCSDT